MSTGIRYKETLKECSSVIQAMELTAGHTTDTPGLLTTKQRHLQDFDSFKKYMYIYVFTGPGLLLVVAPDSDARDRDTRAP